MSKKYLDMQRSLYNNRMLDIDKHIIGYPEHNLRIPYETYLLYENGDIRYPILNMNLKDIVALDYGCGPGRMVKRMSKFLGEVDGVDISEYLIEVAEKNKPAFSSFYVTNGDGIPDTVHSDYHFIYSTLCLQHIPVRSLRKKIIDSCYEHLAPGGILVIQALFNFKGVIPDNHRDWLAEYVDAPSTNSAHDAHITNNTMKYVEEDFSKFKKFSFWFDRSWYTDQTTLEGCSAIYLCGKKQLA